MRRCCAVIAIVLVLLTLGACAPNNPSPPAPAPASTDATPSVAAATGNRTATVSGAATRPATAAPTPDPRIPQKAYDTLQYIRTHNGDPPPGFTGGTTFENRERRLPAGRYREYDVDRNTGRGRNAERLVIDQDTGRAYYTGDHYDTFIPLPMER